AAATFDTQLAEYLTDRVKKSGSPKLVSAALTPPLPLDVLAARDTMAPAERDAIRDAMMAMKRSDEVFVKCFKNKLDSWSEVDDSYYDLVRAFMNVVDPAPFLRLKESCEPWRDQINRDLAGWFVLLD